MSILTNLLDAHAAKKENKAKQKLLDRGADLSRDEFNRRMAEIGLSDTRMLDLSKRGYTDQAANEDATFADLLANAAGGFDQQTTISDETANERLGIEKTSFDTQMDALGGLMTAQRGARLKMQEASEAERQRQLAFQNQADDVATALPGQIGYDAQEAARADSLAGRLSLLNANAPGANVPAWAKGAAGAYAAEDQRGRDVGLGDALASAKVSSYGDAFQASERGIGRAADNISELTTKAGISRSALPAELGVGKLMAEQAGERANFATALAKSMGEKRGDIAADRGSGRMDVSKTYTDATGKARGDFGEKRGSTLADYFDKMFGAESGFINGVSGTSQNLENKLLNLNNFKMNNTSVTSPLANTLRAIEDAMAKAAAGGAG